jgi:hypothetical protein
VSRCRYSLREQNPGISANWSVTHSSWEKNGFRSQCNPSRIVIMDSKKQRPEGNATSKRRSARRQIALHPSGPFDLHLLPDMASGIEDKLGMNPTVGEAISIPSDALSRARRCF